MRLLNARTLQLEEVFDESTNEYAILSHRWEDGEVKFGDIQEKAKAAKLTGFEKIERSCAQAVKDGYSYIWIDTCCIDKSR